MINQSKQQTNLKDDRRKSQETSNSIVNFDPIQKTVKVITDNSESQKVFQVA